MYEAADPRTVYEAASAARAAWRAVDVAIVAGLIGAGVNGAIVWSAFALQRRERRQHEKDEQQAVARQQGNAARAAHDAFALLDDLPMWISDAPFVRFQDKLSELWTMEAVIDVFLKRDIDYEWIAPLCEFHHLISQARDAVYGASKVQDITTGDLEPFRAIISGLAEQARHSLDKLPAKMRPGVRGVL